MRVRAPVRDLKIGPRQYQGDSGQRPRHPIRLVTLDEGDLVVAVARVVSEDDQSDAGEDEPAGVVPENEEE